jgi:hypothetical protein
MADEIYKTGAATASETLTPQDAELAEFDAAYGEKLSDALDLSTWTLGEDFAATLDRLEQEVAEALKREDETRKEVRRIVFPRLHDAPDAPANAGLYHAQRQHLEKIHAGLLFNGGVEACDGTSVAHDTLPLTVMQIGVCLVSYNGEQGSWAHRLYRRDLRSKMADPVDEIMATLDRREKREGVGQEGDSLSELAQRGIMAYAERAILREKSSAIWRMGHGSPAPYELLTGLWSSQRGRIRISLDLIRWYALEHKRFVFVPSAPRKRHWLTIGNALRPLEFAIIQTLKPDIERLIENGGYREGSGVKQEMEKFRDEVAPEIVIGLYRAWEAAPPYLFYAHKDYAEMAAHIAMADSLLQEHRGFPLLIDLADTVCRTTFGAGSFTALVRMAYANAGQPFRYLGERETRSR